MKDTKVKLTQAVIDAIDGELAYQQRMSGTDRADFLDHGVAGQLVTLGVYSRKAKEAWVFSNDEEEALDNLRKVAAIAIRALVLYGCPTREIK